MSEFLRMKVPVTKAGASDAAVSRVIDRTGITNMET
jgi:hypothetical protein